MRTAMRGNVASSVVGAAFLALALPAIGLAQQYQIRPTNHPNGQCRVNTATFGYNDTNWRQWPVQPRPEQTDPNTIGGTRIPTPPPILEPKLPHAETVPSKPALPEGTPGGSILPLPTLTPGAAAPTKIDGSATILPGGATPDRPAGQTPQIPGPQGLQGIPSDLDLAPRPDSKPKTDAATPDPLLPPKDPLLPPKDPLLPGGAAPQILTPTPITPSTEPAKVPAAEPAKSPGKEAPALSPLLPDLTPSPATKPDTLTPDKPSKGSSISRHARNSIAANTAVPSDLPMQANWDASLEADMTGSNHLRSTSYEQRPLSDGNPLRYALDGYCPVQLQDHDHWVAGRPELHRVYQGQIFRFSSDDARKRFDSAPEKYAPVQAGNDIVLLSEENRTVAGSVNHSAVWHGRLYLFASSESLATFQADPSRYASDNRATPLQVPADSL